MPPSRTLLLVVSNILIPIAILAFASGFFPYKPFLPGLAKYEAAGVGQPPKAPFDKIVFMVVDALRSDFVFSDSSGFSFTQRLIADGSAIPYTAHASSPTITMPRIKAITTGSIPSFLDVILNFAESDTSSTLASQDTWIAQMKMKGTGKLVMYGDDTWIKLFPESFDRADGTSSFFVADFTEVDNNVTRHIPEELANSDWNTMVLHYLGLDHIGHKAGSRSPNMIPKQREMDGIVRQIYQAQETYEHLNETLLVLCGDHGMNDAGNHGGSTPGETSAALVFISPKLRTISTKMERPVQAEGFQYYTVVEQSDIAPTLASLLGFPVPRNNLGVFIADFLQFWQNDNDKIQIMLQTTKQIMNVIAVTFPELDFKGTEGSKDCSLPPWGIERLRCEWVNITQQIDMAENGLHPSPDRLIHALSDWSRDAQEIMTNTATNYNMPKLIFGQVLAIVALLLAFITAAPSLSHNLITATPFFLIISSYSTMMFASSYVEEEQHFWYWAASAWLLLLYTKGISRHRKYLDLFDVYGLGALALLRIARRWNQTGQKFAGEPDIARTFLSSHNDFLWILVCASYLASLFHIYRLKSKLIMAVLLVVGASFKLALTKEDSPEQIGPLATVLINSTGFLTADWSLAARAKLVFSTLFIASFFSIGVELSAPSKRGQEFNARIISMHILVVHFLMAQSRATNIPLFMLFQLQSTFLSNLLFKLDLRLIEITTTSLLLQYVSFFAFGGSNAISSIDLSCAYNGVTSFNAAAVGVLVFVSNWAGPIFWTSATIQMLLKLRRKGHKNVLQQHIALLTLFATCSLVGVMVACTLLRTHLFIWTVFSPKYLYSMAWALGQHLLVNIGLGGLLFWLGSS